MGARRRHPQQSRGDADDHQQRHNQNTSALKFRRQIFDPLDTVTVFQERFNQQNIGLVFSDSSPAS